MAEDGLCKGGRATGGDIGGVFGWSLPLRERRRDFMGGGWLW
jgi:hypothetical protein